MPDNQTVARAVGQERFFTPFDMEHPEVNEELCSHYGAQGRPEFMILRNLGMHRPVSRNNGRYYIEDRIRPILHVSGAGMTETVAPSATAKARYTWELDRTAGSNDTILGAVGATATDSPFGATNHFYQPAVQGMNVMFPVFDSNRTGTIVSVSDGSGTGTFTITVELDQINVGLTIASYTQGTPVIIQGSAYAAGSAVPRGLIRGTTQDTWVLQFIQTTHEIDGDAATNRLWVTKNSRGQKISGWREFGQQAADFRHMASIDDALWDGPGQVNPLLATGDPSALLNQNVVYKTEGVIPYARRTGNELGYPIGLFNVQFFDQIDDIVTQNYGPKYFMGCTSAAFQREVNQAMVEYLKHTQLDLISREAEESLFEEIPGTGKRVKVDFKYIEMNNRVYCLHQFYRNDDPHSVGAAGYYGRNFAFFCPIGTKADPRNPGNKVPYFGFYYKSYNGYNRLDEVNARYGATNGKHTLDVDRNIFTYKSHIGAAHCGGINMVVCEGT